MEGAFLAGLVHSPLAAIQADWPEMVVVGAAVALAAALLNVLISD